MSGECRVRVRVRVWVRVVEYCGVVSHRAVSHTGIVKEADDEAPAGL